MSFKEKKALRVLIASGPTRERLDPVRYLSNFSTGTMGRHLEAKAKRRGHWVKRVECPKDAESARDLLRVLRGLLPKFDVLVMVAAVCDVRPLRSGTRKIKKDRLFSIPVVKNPDLLKELAKIKKKGQVFIGFGLESDRVLENGRKKLISKSLEAIVLQEVTDKISPFGDKKVKAYILPKKGGLKVFGSVAKARLAGLVVREAELAYRAENIRD